MIQERIRTSEKLQMKLSHYVSLPDLHQAEGGQMDLLRSRQYKLYHQSGPRSGLAALSVPNLLLLEDQHNWLMTPGPVLAVNPPQRTGKGMFRKGKKQTAQREMFNKYEKRKYFKKTKLLPLAPQTNLLKLAGLSKSETSLVRPSSTLSVFR